MPPPLCVIVTNLDCVLETMNKLNFLDPEPTRRLSPIRTALREAARRGPRYQHQTDAPLSEVISADVEALWPDILEALEAGVEQHPISCLISRALGHPDRAVTKIVAARYMNHREGARVEAGLTNDIL